MCRCGKNNIQRVTASDGSLSTMWHGASYCEACKKTKGPTGMQKNVQELGDSVAQLGKTTAKAGSTFVDKSFGDGARQVGAVGSQVAQVGADVATEAFKRGGFLGGVSMGVGFFVGPGLAAFIALCSSEIWFLVLGSKIWNYDWLYGLGYYFVTGGGLVLAILPALGVMNLCVSLATPKTIDAAQNKKEAGKKMAMLSLRLIAVSFVVDIVCIGIGIAGWGVLMGGDSVGAVSKETCLERCEKKSDVFERISCSRECRSND